jgi:hypothetical protein
MASQPNPKPISTEHQIMDRPETLIPAEHLAKVIESQAFPRMS